MKCYRVGGFVRDKILGLESKDVDYVVVGSSIEEMMRLGYQQVGADFPVFLHPRTGEEYALARTERKSSAGHTGFQTDTSCVTLEEDLRRRDITINSMAMDSDGNIIDPFGGIADLKAGILRHTSDAFSEDPLRVLRVARFAARFNFTIAPETVELMTSMREELKTLTPERVWAELEKSLKTERPFRFIQVLEHVKCLDVVLPEIANLFGVPQPIEYHPEGNVDAHMFLVMDQICRLSDDPVVRWAALVHDLGKGATPREEWPKHIDHETRGVALIEALCDRIKAPAEYKQLGMLVSELHLRRHRCLAMNSGSILEMLNKLKCRHGTELLEKFLLACEADARGRGGEAGKRPQPQTDFLRQCGKAIREIKAVDRTEEFKERLATSTDPDVIAAMEKRLKRAKDPKAIVGRLIQEQCKAIDRIKSQFKDEGSIE